MKKINLKPKFKFKKIKIGYIFAFLIILAVCILVLKLVLPSSGINKYGDRLEGIKENEFTEKEEKKVIKSIKEKEQVVSCSIDVEGKLINVIFTVKKDVSKDDAKNIANESIDKFSEKVKGYYDIQFMVKKKDEEGTKELRTLDDSTTEEITKYEFPIMGYKSRKSERIVW